MYRPAFIILMCAAAIVAAQTSSTYQQGTVTSVIRHQHSSGAPQNDVIEYEVSIRVSNTIYVVLYAPPNGANAVEYAAGMDLLVMVGKDTLTFNSKLSGTTQVPILRREQVQGQDGVDWSKVPSQYFSMKLQHLSDALDLNQDQRTKIKPVLEHEAAEVNQIWLNPVISQKDKLNRFEKIVQASDQQIKPLLSGVQLKKLQAMRKDQKQDLKRIVAEGKPTNQD